MRLLTVLAVSLAVALPIGSIAFADQISNYVKDGVAIGGADPVAYFTENKSEIGSPDFTTEWNGVTWRFASAVNRDVFKSNAAKYAPKFGGFCTVGTGFGKKIPIDPEQFKIVGGKLYLNSSPKAQSIFLGDETGTINKAEGKWPDIENVPADKL